MHPPSAEPSSGVNHEAKEADGNGTRAGYRRPAELVTIDLADTSHKKGGGPPIPQQQGRQSSLCSSEGSPAARKSLGLAELLLATVISMGVQLDWSVQAAQLTPYLLVVGVPYQYYTLACLCGPISGLIVQPLMGVFSDHCHSRLGRRRPFIIAGVLLIVFGLMLIANSSYIGRTLWGTSARHAREGDMVMAIVGLWIVDMANNALAGPCRALIADIAPSEQQRLGNSLMAVWSSIGSVIGFMICAVPWARSFPNVESEHCKLQCADVRVVTSICAVTLLATASFTIVFTRETPLGGRFGDDAPEGPRSGAAMVGKLLHMLLHMPPALARICAFQFLAWSAWFYHSLFIAVWVGKTVNEGDGASPVGSEPYLRYESGIKAASLGLVLFAIVTGLSSMALPSVLHRFKTRRTLAAAQITLCLCYLATFLVPRRRIYVAASVIMLFALPWSVFIVVPFAITAQMAPADQRGLYLGSLNIFAVLPQILVSLSGPVFARIFGDQGATQAAFGFSAMLALGSLAVVPFIITKVRVIEHKPPLQGPAAPAHPRAALEAPVLQEVEPVEALSEEEEEGIIKELPETPLLSLYHQYSSSSSRGGSGRRLTPATRPHDQGFGGADV